MKRVTVDIKSLFLGMCLSVVVLFLFSFNKSSSEAVYPVGKFQAVSSERGFMILDTQTGDFILDSEVNYIGKMTWIKGDFSTSFASGKDKTKD